ncbi:MAG: DUF6044 family protein [Bacteroidota bacterium]
MDSIYKNENQSLIDWCNTHAIGIGGLFLFFLPYLILGQDSIWYANDYLELVVPWYKLLINQEAVLKPNDYVIYGMLDQLPRGIFASEFFLVTWLFYLLKPFQAILLNKILIHTIAFLSMNHAIIYFFRSELKNWQIQCLALSWSTLAFWPESGIAVASFPTIMFLFYTAAQGEKLTLPRILFILFYACYSLLHLHGVFVGVMAFFYGLITWFRTTSFPKAYAYHFMLFTILSSLTNYRHFLLFFGGGFTPHRLEYDPYSFAGFFEKFWPVVFDFFAFGSLHSVQFNPFLLLFSFLGIMIGFLRPTNYSAMAIKTMVWAVLIGMLAVVSRYLPLINLLPKGIPVWFSWDRFIFVTYPLMILALIFKLIHLNKIYKPSNGFLLPLFILIFCYNYFVLDDNHRNYFLKPLIGLGEKYPTFKEFYAQRQFTDIKSKIHQLGGGKVASIGLHPGIAIYNELHALDGYSGIYSLAYKKEFGEIIKPELEKIGVGSYLHLLFFGWGNKAYLFNQELGDDFMRFKWKSRIKLSTDYNLKHFLQMGGRFLLSTEVLIQDGVTLIEVFEQSDSAWTIFMYEVQ